MAQIARLGEYNRFRQHRNELADMVKIDMESDEVVYVHKTEIKTLLLEYIENDLDYFSKNASDNIKNQFRERVDTKLKDIESSLNTEINRQFDRIAERIVSATTDRIIEAEVNRRVDEKLQKLKKLL